MKKFKLLLKVFAALCAAGLIISLLLLLYLPHASYGFAYETDSKDLRLSLVEEAMLWLGAEEGSEEHKAIIDGYNAHTPLAQGYTVTYEDNWCAAFVSFAAIQKNLTDIIPTECGCERQIGLWQELGRWEETDTYLPLPGDIIYYDWDVKTMGDSTGWSDHVGIVVGTWGPFIKVIEGNKEDSVALRCICRWDPRIRGYGLPDY